MRKAVGGGKEKRKKREAIATRRGRASRERILERERFAEGGGRAGGRFNDAAFPGVGFYLVLTIAI